MDLDDAASSVLSHTHRRIIFSIGELDFAVIV